MEIIPFIVQTYGLGQKSGLVKEMYFCQTYCEIQIKANYITLLHTISNYLSFPGLGTIALFTPAAITSLLDLVVSLSGKVADKLNKRLAIRPYILTQINISDVYNQWFFILIRRKIRLFVIL